MFVWSVSMLLRLRWAPVWISSQWIKACFSWYDPWQRAKTVWRQTELFIKSSDDVRQIPDSRKHPVIPYPCSWRCANKHTQGLHHAIQKPASPLCVFTCKSPKNVTGAFWSPLLLESPDRTYHDLSRQEKSGLRAAHQRLKVKTISFRDAKGWTQHFLPQSSTWRAFLSVGTWERSEAAGNKT